jgi:pimeloyl-ACP methyl ester carboxylesterase
MLIFVSFAVVFVICCAWLYQWIADQRAIRNNHYPGKLVDVGGRKFHIHITGVQDGPTVVFDHGCGYGSSSLIWQLVVEEVGKFAKVVVYDRAGYGWSDSGMQPRTNGTAVEELHQLLQATGISGPYLLVGHSYGGINARIYAHRYPNHICGIVLVDATHEDELTDRFPQEHIRGQLLGRKLFKILAVLGKFGLVRLMMKWNSDFKRLVSVFPNPVQKQLRATAALSKTAITVASEFAHLDEGYAQVRAVKSLGKLPLTVIKSGKVDHLEKMTESVSAKIKQALYDVALDMKNLSEQGVLIVAENSGHNVHVEQPEIVVDAIRQMIKDCLQEKQLCM